MPDDIVHLKEIERRLLWLSCWTIHNANHLRPKVEGEVKVGGRSVERHLLADGDELQMGKRVRMKFRMPTSLSSTASSKSRTAAPSTTSRSISRFDAVAID